MHPAGVVNRYTEAVSEVPCILVVERVCNSRIYPESAWIRWAVNENATCLFQSHLEVP